MGLAPTGKRSLCSARQERSFHKQSMCETNAVVNKSKARFGMLVAMRPRQNSWVSGTGRR